MFPSYVTLPVITPFVPLHRTQYPLHIQNWLFPSYFLVRSSPWAVHVYTELPRSDILRSLRLCLDFQFPTALSRLRPVTLLRPHHPSPDRHISVSRPRIPYLFLLFRHVSLCRVPVQTNFRFTTRSLSFPLQRVQRPESLVVYNSRHHCSVWNRTPMILSNLLTNRTGILGVWTTRPHS